MYSDEYFCLSFHRGLMPRTLDSQITMEKTPSYFVTREAPRRISNMSHKTKLIVVVRNPVTRAISDYTQTLSKKPDIPSFEELAFKNRSQGIVDTSWNAIRIGMYILHLENWLQYFRLSQIHFVSGERLITDPAGELGRVQDFLGLKRIISDKHFYFNRTKGFPCLKKPESSSQPRCLGKSKGRTHVQIDQEVIEQLREFYRPFNVKFYEMVGHDFRWDWGGGPCWNQPRFSDDEHIFMGYVFTWKCKWYNDLLTLKLLQTCMPVILLWNKHKRWYLEERAICSFSSKSYGLLL